MRYASVIQLIGILTKSLYFESFCVMGCNWWVEEVRVWGVVVVRCLGGEEHMQVRWK